MEVLKGLVMLTYSPATGQSRGPNALGVFGVSPALGRDYRSALAAGRRACTNACC